MAALSRPSLRSASQRPELSATGIQRKPSTHITKNGKRTRDLALLNVDNCILKKQRTVSSQAIGRGYDADSLVASADKFPKGVVTQSPTLQSENARKYVRNTGTSVLDAESTPNGTVHECGTVVVARKVDKRSLRSQDGGSRSKSELALYFPNYDELVSIEPKESGMRKTNAIIWRSPADDSRVSDYRHSCPHHR